jgi:hypothetical protein
MRTLALTTLAILTTASLVVGCSSSSSPPAASSAGDSGATGDAGPSALTTVTFNMEETVPADAEIFDCQYVQLPSANAWLVAGQHDYTPGSHHLLLYTTDLTSIPAGGGQVQDCYEGTNNNIMSNARGVLYAAQTPTGGVRYPQGVGLPASAGEVLIFQVHYLNASATSLDAKVDVNLTFDTNAADIQQQAGVLFFYDPFIDVPAGATAKASMRCSIPSDITLLYASSHYHSRGVGYGAWNDRDPATLATTPFYTSDSWSSPDNATLAMSIKGGSLVRFECDYDNTAGTSAYFAGQSAQTNEMCMFIGQYYPDLGPATDFCMHDPDMFGTGPATCSATLSCLQACGGGVQIDNGFEPSVSDCAQTCFVDSCPTASGPLIAFTDCTQKSCAGACSPPSSSTCTGCIAANCAAEYTACQSQTCP